MGGGGATGWDRAREGSGSCPLAIWQLRTSESLLPRGGSLYWRGGSLLRGYLAMPGDTADCHTGSWGATIPKDQSPGVLLILPVHRTGPTTKVTQP